MYIFPIVSSSDGNCTYIKSKDTSILIDCGMTVKALETALDKDTIKALDAVFITHEHSDHIDGLKVFGKKYHKVPVYMNEYSYQVKESRLDTIERKDLNAGEEVVIKDLKIMPFSTKHDVANCLGFLIDDGTNTLGYVTDTGSVSKLMRQNLSLANILFIESDYDDEKLAEYEHYEAELKERIGSNFGHLSNNQVIEVITSLGLDNLKRVIFGHLSPRTNSPEIIFDKLKPVFPNDLDKFIIAPTTEGLTVD